MKPPIERAQGPEIAVIVVIVTQEHERDRGQVVESHARAPEPDGGPRTRLARSAYTGSISRLIAAT